MATCGTYLSSDDIFRHVARVYDDIPYLNMVYSSVSGAAVGCVDSLLKDDILNLLFTTDLDGDYALRAIISDPPAPPSGGGLELTFVDLSTNEFAGFTTVADWNTFFNLPANGTPFDSVSVNGNTVTLLGGGGITLDAWLFADNYYPPKFPYQSDLVSIVDNDGVIEVAGDYCFRYCTPLTTVDLQALITAGDACFDGCTGLTLISAPLLETANDECFVDCTSLTTIDLSSCTDLGSTVGDDGVFDGISGNTITLTVPAALMTCDGGNPDGDIVYLDNNNTLTIIQVV